MSRPVTSKARGTCKYYNTDRGCYAANNCKFLHGETATHTPYDKAKTCRFYAAGFCKRGTSCWFAHTKGKQKEIDEEDDLCSICFENPVTYGLLTGCSHVFCITCIKQWRSSVDKSLDVVESGNTKRCPMCRQPAKFIIPSSAFYAQGHPEKDVVISRYKESMKKVPCKYFQRSLAGTSTPYCPFSNDCFYQHRNADGSEHVATHGADLMRRYAIQRDLPTLRRSDLIHSLENVFVESARLGLTPFHDDGWEEETTVMRRLELLADQMLASLTGQALPLDRPESGEDEPMPPLEVIPAHHQRDGDPSMPLDTDSDDEMPVLASVPDSSDSDAPSDSEDDDDELEINPSVEIRHQFADQRMVRPFDFEFHHGTSGPHQNPGVLVRLSGMASDQEPTLPEPSSSSLAVNAAIDPVLEDEVDQTAGIDESDIPSLQPEPPFVTDGRGRVVWSSLPDSGTGSSARRASATLPAVGSTRASPVDKPPSPRQSLGEGEGGFTTDGRGRVIGTTGVHEAEDETDPAEETSGTAPRRSFFGRMFNALF